MDKNLKKKHRNLKEQMHKERRSFLKKTVYAAPKLIVLGQLIRPTSGMAESQPPGGPGGGFGGGTTNNGFTNNGLGGGN